MPSLGLTKHKFSVFPFQFFSLFVHMSCYKGAATHWQAVTDGMTLLKSTVWPPRCCSPPPSSLLALVSPSWRSLTEQATRLSAESQNSRLTRKHRLHCHFFLYLSLSLCVRHRVLAAASYEALVPALSHASRDFCPRDP